MLDSATKNKINAARDILVGKIPDPKGQIDQITNALIYKFMDDQDQESISIGGVATHFVGDLTKYAWHNLFDPKLDNQERADLYREGLDKLSVSSTLPEFFRDVFKNTYLPFRDAGTISMFIKQINEFEYRSEELGNAFEYLLQIMGSQGDAGQFRTPRNIIEFIVNIIDPTKSDKILDPACGTAGFLIESYKHIKETGNLSQSDRKGLADNLTGVDIDPGMAKIARVNLYLHGFTSPKITEDDTLSNESLWLKEKFDVILANPPFMTPKGGITPHKKFSISSNRAEVLFVDYIAEHLKLNGRAGIIVPEGIIFQSGTAYKSLRKKLVDEGYLHAVISLPSGVFQPYSGVKTSILVLDRQKARESENILFIKIQNDGYDLGAQRREITKNDLPQALEIYNEFVTATTESPSSNDNGLDFALVPKTKIAETPDYNLSGDRYKTATDYTNAKWPMVELGEFEKEGKIEFLRGQGLSKKDLVEDGLNKCIHYGEIYTVYEPIIENILSRTNFEGKITSLKGDVLVPATTTADAMGIAVARSLKENGVIIGGDINIIRTENKHILSDYLAFLISTPPLKIELSTYAKGANILHLSNSDLRKLKIPLPPLHIQEEIVAEIDGYQKIIHGAKQVVENWKPRILVDAGWEKVKLSDVCDIQRGKFSFRPRNEPRFYGGKYPFIQTGDVVRAQNGKISFTQTLNEDGLTVSKLFNPPLVLITIAANIGDTAVLDYPACFPDSVVGLTPFKSVNVHYLELIMRSKKEYLNSIAPQAAQKNINIEILKPVEIPLPPLEIQQKIVEEIEAERVLVEGNKKLIEIYEGKVREAIGRVWGE